MKKTSRKLLSLFLAVVMALSMIPMSSITAFAEGGIGEGSDGGGSTGEIKEGIDNFEWIARGDRFVRFTIVQLTNKDKAVLVDRGGNCVPVSLWPATEGQAGG